MSGFKLRAASFDDLPGILAIHNDIILNTNAIWQEKPDDLDERRVWMNERLEKKFPVLVAENEDVIAAFGSYGTWRARQCYRRTVEHSVHVHRDFRGHGLGRLMVSALIELAKAQGKHVMIGGMSADNEGSLRLHAQLGFHETGRIKEVGLKFGRTLDLVFMQKVLA